MPWEFDAFALASLRPRWTFARASMYNGANTERAAGMRPAKEWAEELAGAPERAEVLRIEGRGGAPTLQVDKALLHSRYNPEQEAARLVDSAKLETGRPVLAIGLGLGYHALELARRGFEVAALEPDPLVARYAIEGPMRGSDIPLGVGDAGALAADPDFAAFSKRNPQLLVHPPTARLHPDYADAVRGKLAAAALGAQRLNVAVVGPMYGGSLPIARYLADAFRSAGHNARLVDNSIAWALYKNVMDGVEDGTANAQLTAMLTTFLSEWSYARVAEFNPEICIVMAQAPVNQKFPLRLRQNGIVTAFWYVENWRHLPYWKDIAAFYDCFFHIQPGEFERKLDEIGCRHHAFIQTGCDPAKHRPVQLTEAERDEFGCDVSFAGAGYYNRVEFFKGLTDYRFRIWGVDWPARELTRLMPQGEGRFDFETFMKIVAASKINFNLHSSTTHEGVDPKCDAINPRVFEIAAAGGFQVCDPCQGLENHFDFETELPVYRSLKEARALLDYYLAHPEERAAVAKRAQARALKDHTYEARARQMLDFIFERHGARILERGVRVQRTVEEMAIEAGTDTELGQWLTTLPEGLLFTHDAINALLPPADAQSPYPVKLFHYLREVRNFAETMLKMPR